MQFRTSLMLGATIAGLLTTGYAMAQEQYIGLPVYRVGPYGGDGASLFGGWIDYMQMLNQRDGGVNGVKLVWEECETEYNNARGVACYERMKNRGPTGNTSFQPLGTGITYAVLDRVAEDKIPLVTIGYGRTDAADGRVFPWVFPLITTYWSQNTAKIRFIGQQEGGMENLRGKKIVNLYLDGAYGTETMPVLEAQAKKYGFTVVHIPVASPGSEQQTQWLRIRQERPDWVILRGWGVMNPTAIRTASRIGFPRERMVGVWWSGSEEAVIPVGDGAKGFIAAGFNVAGREFPVIQEIDKHVYAKNLGNMEQTNLIGSVLYNRGVVHGIITVEAIRKAQEKYGEGKSLTGEEVRWGFENLDITNERLTELGADGFLPPLKTSCEDHEGSGMVKFQQWDGTQWHVITDWIQSDQDLVRPMIEASAAAYAAEKGITPRDCAAEM